MSNVIRKFEEGNIYYERVQNVVNKTVKFGVPTCGWKKDDIVDRQITQ